MPCLGGKHAISGVKHVAMLFLLVFYVLLYLIQSSTLVLKGKVLGKKFKKTRNKNKLG